MNIEEFLDVGGLELEKKYTLEFNKDFSAVVDAIIKDYNLEDDIYHSENGPAILTVFRELALSMFNCGAEFVLDNNTAIDSFE